MSTCNICNTPLIYSDWQDERDGINGKCPNCKPKMTEILIGKIWDDANQKSYWAEAPDFETLIQALRNEVSDWGGNDEFDPAKIEVWKATKMKVVAKYEIEAND